MSQTFLDLHAGRSRPRRAKPTSGRSTTLGLAQMFTDRDRIFEAGGAFHSQTTDTQYLDKLELDARSYDEDQFASGEENEGMYSQ